MTDAEALESVQQFLSGGMVRMEAIARVLTLATASVANAEKFQECREAIISAYFAGTWTCDCVDAQAQAKAWERLRDAAGIPEGSATAKGVGR